MAAPEAGLREWQLKRLKELGITSWKNKDDAIAKLTQALKDKAKKNEEKQKSGFGAIDAKAEDKKTETAKTETNAPVAPKVEVLPASQKVDVSAPTINVHVPAPGVTITNDNFKWYPFACKTFAWVQAAIIGASIYNALSSRLSELVISAVVR